MAVPPHHDQWSVEVPNTSRPPTHPSGGRGNIRRSHDPLASPSLGSNGVRTLYEAFRRGRDINPLGPCLGYRATRWVRHTNVPPLTSSRCIMYAYLPPALSLFLIPRVVPSTVSPPPHESSAATADSPRPMYTGATASAWLEWMRWRRDWRRAARIYWIGTTMGCSW